MVMKSAAERKLGRFKPKLPDIGIGDGEAGPALHLRHVALDGGSGQLAPEEHLVADDERLDHVRMLAGEPERRLDLATVLGAIPPEPDALQHLEALRPGQLGDPPLRPNSRIGANAGSERGEAPQVALDLGARNIQPQGKRRLLAMERSVGDAR